MIKLTKTLIFFSIFALEAHATRVLMVPMFRTRYDIYPPRAIGAADTTGSVNGATEFVQKGFKNNVRREPINSFFAQIKYVNLRLRIELQNISDKKQTVHLYLRKESWGGMMSFSGGRMTIKSSDLDPKKPHLGKKVYSATMTAYDKQTVFLDATCSDIQTGTANCVWTIGSTDIKPSVSTDVSALTNLMRFGMDQSIGLSIEIEEDIGAITGALSSILNNTQGYEYDANPPAQIIFNGGKPF